MFSGGIEKQHRAVRGSEYLPQALFWSNLDILLSILGVRNLDAQITDLYIYVERKI